MTDNETPDLEPVSPTYTQAALERYLGAVVLPSSNDTALIRIISIIIAS
jgi:hypothetical protein